MSKIAVVGGSGYIGSHVVDELIKQGHEVDVLDIMKPHRPDVNFKHIDITDFSRTIIPLTGNYDVVYLLAAVADVRDMAKIPVEACQINVMGVVNVLEAMRKLSIPRLIFSSTVWCYESALEQNVDENTPFSLNRCNNIYTASKIAAELFINAYFKLYGAPNFTILRYGIPYSGRARRGTVIESFVTKALAGQPLTIQGDGLQTRKFVNVEDLARGNVAALSPKAANQTYNLEGSELITIKQIAETVQRLVGNVQITYLPARAGDYEGKNVSAEKAKRELGWTPQISFEEGMKKYIEWRRSLK